MGFYYVLGTARVLIKNMHYFILFFLFIFASIDIIANENEDLTRKPIKLSLKDEEVSRVFFRNLFSSTSAGFVLYGQKPVCLYNFQNIASALPGTDLHRFSTEIKEGLNLWEKCHFENKQSNYIFHLSHNPKNLSTFDNELLIINRQAFLDAVNKNLILFQYQLGINVTAESLLNQLLDQEEDISSIFKGRQGLLGIVLGYGTINSLSYERGTNLIKSLSKNATLTPPYQSNLFFINEEKLKKRLTEANFSPGFGYNSCREEIEELSHSMTHSMTETSRIGDKLAFSYHKDTEETKQLLAMLDDAQLEIDKLLNSHNFLEKIFEKLNTKVILTKEEVSPIDPKWIPRLPDIVTRTILINFFDSFSEEEYFKYLTNFVTGMREADKENIDKKSSEKYETVEFLDSFKIQLTSNPIMKRNLIQSKYFFKKNVLQPNVHCIEPMKLYYRIIREGQGSSIESNTKDIIANYAIRNSEGKILSGNYALSPAESLDLSKVIAGFVHGLVGMKKNEIREIFVHPDLAYGLHSEFGEGQPLCIQIELIDWKKNSDKFDLPELIPWDLIHLSQNSIKSASHLDQLKNKHAFACGYKIWQHYKKNGNLFMLENILKIINNLQQKDGSEFSLEEDEQKVVQKLDWLIYQNSFSQ